jgi:hypothetical protein
MSEKRKLAQIMNLPKIALGAGAWENNGLIKLEY